MQRREFLKATIGMLFVPSFLKAKEPFTEKKLSELMDSEEFQSQTFTFCDRGIGNTWYTFYVYNSENELIMTRNISTNELYL